MDVSGKNEKLWINKREKRDGGIWLEYSVGIGKRNMDGKYINAYMRVKFSKSCEVPSMLPNGVKMNYEGFMTIDEYESRGEQVRKPMVMITRVEFPDYEYQMEDSFSEVDEDVPF